ncbi:MAG: chitobiase/beta-hexosaminidase C-terminal domain-containing protein, partial [Cyanobacteria bacterium REEB67]|nr:chitobiase/beta-hexosaminidase C-terminal domain-containing protein [Cyanobacteria bacterium REEB67]
MVVPTLSRKVECESLFEAMHGYFWKFVCSLVLYLSFIVLPASATTAPAISPSTGVYSTAQASATITADAGASIYFTLDGSTPNPASSTPYTAPITLNSVNTIKAIAVLSGVSSSVTTANIQNDENSVVVA